MLKNRVFVSYVVSVVKICFLRHIQYKVFLHVLTLPKLVTVTEMLARNSASSGKDLLQG